MHYKAYDLNNTILSCDFLLEDGIVSSKNNSLFGNKESVCDISLLKENTNDCALSIDIKTNKTLGSETELYFFLELKDFNETFKIVMNNIVLERIKRKDEKGGHEIVIYNALSQKNYLTYNHTGLILRICIRHIRKKLFVYDSFSLLTVLSIADLIDSDKPISLKLFSNKDENILLTGLSISSLQKGKDNYYLDNYDLKYYLNENPLSEKIEKESLFYSIKGKSNTLHLQKREIKYYDIPDMPLFEITNKGLVYFCFNRARMYYIDYQIISKILRHNKQIYENESLIASLSNESLKINPKLLCLLESFECKEFQYILDDVCNLKNKEISTFEKYINIEYGKIEVINMSEIITSLNSFKINFVTNDNYLVVEAENFPGNKNISTKVRYPQFNSFEFCFSIDFSESEKNTILNCFDYTIEISKESSDFCGVCIDNTTGYPDYSFFEIKIYYFKDNRRKEVLHKAVPDNLGTILNFKIQKIEDYHFFTVNSVFIGCILRPQYTIEKLEYFQFSLESNEENSLIKIGELAITEIVEHGLNVLNDKIEGYKSEELYYISIRRDYMQSDGYGGGYDNYFITRINDFKTAKEKIEDSFWSVSNRDKQDISSYSFIVVTNDFKLINCYRNTMVISDFKDLNWHIDFHYFGLILFGFCIQCRTFEEKEDYLDEDNGNTYSVPVDSGWIICNKEKY